MLVANQLSFNVWECSILRSVSLKLSSGEIIALVGPNGAGKTTLLRCLLGLIPYSGSITLLGQDLRSYRRIEIAREIGFVPQVTESLPDYSVRHFVELGLYPSLFSEANTTQQVTRVLELTECSHLSSRRMQTLSGGERQRVLLAAAIVTNPQFLVLDEPTSFLDPKHRVSIYRMLQRLQQERQLGICIASHHINAVTRVADRIVALKNGEIAFEGSPGNFLNKETLQHVYETEFVVENGYAHPLV